MYGVRPLRGEARQFTYFQLYEQLISSKEKQFMESNIVYKSKTSPESQSAVVFPAPRSIPAQSSIIAVVFVVVIIVFLFLSLPSSSSVGRHPVPAMVFFSVFGSARFGLYEFHILHT